MFFFFFLGGGAWQQMASKNVGIAADLLFVWINDCDVKGPFKVMFVVCWYYVGRKGYFFDGLEDTKPPSCQPLKLLES